MDTVNLVWDPDLGGLCDHGASRSWGFPGGLHDQITAYVYEHIMGAVDYLDDFDVVDKCETGDDGRETWDIEHEGEVIARLRILRRPVARPRSATVL